MNKKKNKTYKFLAVDKNIKGLEKNIIYGIVAVFMGILFIYTIITLKIFSVGSWDFGFIDPSTSFAETLIFLYNFIGSFLFLVLVIVLILMGRILYLFNGNLKLEENEIIKRILIFFINLVMEVVLLINSKKLVSYYLYRLNGLIVKNSNGLNVWYLNYDVKEFLKVSDLSEYKQLEFIGCILPGGALFLIAGPSFSLVFSLDSFVDPEINIKVIGKQGYGVYSFDNAFYDLMNNSQFEIYKNMKGGAEMSSFNYDSVMVNEDDLVIGTHRLLEVDNRLLIPVGVPVRFLITSTDVLHSGAIPSLGLKVDAIPGRLNQFIVDIKKPGVFYGQCSELCGPMHGFMPIILQAVTFKEYKEGLFIHSTVKLLHLDN